MITLTPTKNHFIVFKDISAVLPLAVSCVFTNTLTGKADTINAVVVESHSFYTLMLSAPLTIAGQLSMKITDGVSTLYEEEIKNG